MKWEKNPAGEIKVLNLAISIIFCNNYNQTNLFLEQILIFIFLKKPCGVFPPFENVGEKPRAGFKKNRGVFEKPRGVFNFDHFFHYDGIYFFSHNHMFCSLMSVFMYFSGFEPFAPLER